MAEFAARSRLERDETLTSRADEPERRVLRYAWAALALLGAAGIGALVLAERRTPEPAEAARASERSEPARPEPLRAAGTHASTTITVADDGLPIMPHDPHDAVPAGPVHPHPHTPAHDRIYHENNLIASLNGAMDVKDAAGLRRLLEQYREEYPEDANELQEGYAVIADCLDQPGEAATARAHRYYDTETASSLRRYVRRHCFERAP